MHYKWMQSSHLSGLSIGWHAKKGANEQRQQLEHCQPEEEKTDCPLCLFDLMIIM